MCLVFKTIIPWAFCCTLSERFGCSLRGTGSTQLIASTEYQKWSQTWDTVETASQWQSLGGNLLSLMDGCSVTEMSNQYWPWGKDRECDVWGWVPEDWRERGSVKGRLIAHFSWENSDWQRQKAKKYIFAENVSFATVVWSQWELSVSSWLSPTWNDRFPHILPSFSSVPVDVLKRDQGLAWECGRP